jgi:hypothetical protein
VRLLISRDDQNSSSNNGPKAICENPTVLTNHANQSCKTGTMQGRCRHLMRKCSEQIIVPGIILLKSLVGSCVRQPWNERVVRGTLHDEHLFHG